MNNFEMQLSEYLYGQTDSVELLSAPNPLPDHVYFCRSCSYISSKEKCPNCGSEETE